MRGGDGSCRLLDGSDHGMGPRVEESAGSEPPLADLPGAGRGGEPCWATAVQEESRAGLLQSGRSAKLGCCRAAVVGEERRAGPPPPGR